MNDLRFPIGEFDIPTEMKPADRAAAVESIAGLPDRLEDAVSGLSDNQLDTRYRPEGWTVRQVTHHLPESHLNAYIRTKIGLTENEGVVRTYEEARWAELADASAPVELSVTLLRAVHAKWVFLFRLLDEQQWKARFVHPDLGPMSIEQQVAMYHWHGEHHVAHITALRERMSW